MSVTDLERVRRALGGIYKGEQERPGIREAYEALDAHLKEDAERDRRWELSLGHTAKDLKLAQAELAERDRRIMFCPEGHVVYVNDPKPGRDYACARCDFEAELAELRAKYEAVISREDGWRDQLAELRDTLASVQDRETKAWQDTQAELAELKEAARRGCERDPLRQCPKCRQAGQLIEDKP